MSDGRDIKRLSAGCVGRIGLVTFGGGSFRRLLAAIKAPHGWITRSKSLMLLVIILLV